MRNRIIILIIALAAMLIFGGCKHIPSTATPTTSGLVIITPTSEPTNTATPIGGYPAPASAPQIVTTIPTAYPAPSLATPVPLVEETTYPGPVVTSPTHSTSETTNTPVNQTVTTTAIPSEASPYLPPVDTPTSISASVSPTSLAYPGLIASSTPVPGGTYPEPGNITPTITSQIVPSPTPTVSGTPMVIPEEIPPVPAVTPPPVGSLVRIWHSLNSDQTRALDTMIDAFQDIYPEIRFIVTIIPQADLRRSYETAVYYGGGPNLLLAPAEWGPAYYDDGLVSNLAPYATNGFLSGINPAALETGYYKGALIGLPLSQEGVVLYRNTRLIPEPAETFDELTANSRATTRAGNLGAYFDRGAFFSAGNLGGLGGGMMDFNQNPMFNDLTGLTWLDLLEAYDVAGAVGLNTNRDLELFQTGRIGYIIEGTWQLESLTQALGEENLAIDPWPTFGTGHLSGFVQADLVFLNPNTKSGDMYAAMLFMGYLLTPDVQQYLAEFGMIPVAKDANPRPIHIAQAAQALADGTAYPPVANPRVLTAYWEGLEMAIQAVFTKGVDPQDALDSAEDLVLERLNEISP